MENILKSLECPVCTECMEPPIRNCLNGHSFCDKCSQRLAKCPICRSDIGNSINHAVGNIYNIFKVPCSNKEEGCTFSDMQWNITKHEQFCVHQESTCLILDNGRRTCNWQGKIKNMANHCMDKHVSDNSILGSKYLHMSQFLGSTFEDQRCYIMVYTFECLFHIQLQVNMAKKEFYWVVRLFGTEEDADNYYFHIEYSNNSVKLQRNGDCNGWDYSRMKHISLSFTSFLDLFTPHEKVHCHVSVYKRSESYCF